MSTQGNVKRKLTAIVFTDIVGFTELSAQNEPAALELLEKQRLIFKPIVESHNGTWLKEIGDGLLLSFDTNIEAVVCAIAMQNAVEGFEDLILRIGIHQGEVVIQGNDVLGDDVNIASRIEPFSPIGGIAISDRVNSSLKRNPTFNTKFIGKPNLKGVQQEISIYCINSHGLSSKTNYQANSKLESKSNVFKFAGFGLFGFLIFLGLFFFFSNKDSIEPDNLSIAVLPFANMSTDEENEYFSDGITEEILNSLAQMQKLFVAARTSSFAFKNKNIDIREIGKQLSVAHVLEGSVRKFGDDIRVTAQLIRVSDGFHLWSETYDRKFREIFKVQKELSDAIAKQMEIKLIGEEIVERRGLTNNPDALDLYMQGRFLWNQNQKKSVLRSIEYFKLALEKDQNYALAFSAIADAYYSLVIIKRWTVTNDDRGLLLQKSEDYALKALNIEPDLGEAFAVLGALYSGDKISKEWKVDRKKSQDYFEKSINLNPKYVQAYLWYSKLKASKDDIDESEKLFFKALELDPLSAQVNLVGGQLYYGKIKNPEVAISYYEKAFELDPFLVYGHYNYNYTTLLERMNQWDRAELSWKNAFQTDSTFFGTLWGLSMHYIERGNQQNAMKYLEKLKYHYILNPLSDKRGNSDINLLDGWYHLVLNRDYENAINQFKIAFKEYPCYDSIIPDIAYCFGKLGKFEEGLEYINSLRDKCKEAEYDSHYGRQYLVCTKIGELIIHRLNGKDYSIKPILDLIPNLESWYKNYLEMLVYLFNDEQIKAINLLAKLVESHETPEMLNNHPFYEKLKGISEFDNLIEKINY